MLYCLLLVMQSLCKEWEIRPNAQTSLRLYEVLEDALDSYDYKVYTLESTPTMLSNKSLIITLIPQVGNPLLAIECDEQPKLMEYYEWQSESTLLRQIVITAAERQALNCSDSKFYIGVSTTMPTGYQLYTRVNSGVMELVYNMPVSGELTPNELVVYRINTLGEPQEITFQLQQGNNIQLHLKRCQVNDCTIELNDFNISSTEQPDKQITFLHEENQCKQCYYLMGLHSITKQQYRILVKHNETYTMLREGINDYGYIDEGQYIYYMFQVPKDRNIKQMNIQLTTIHGSVTMYASSSIPYPTKDQYNLTSNTLISTNNTMQLTIGVYGNQHSQYGIYASIERNTTEDSIKLINLQSGIPQQYTQSNEFAFYSILIDSNVKQNITITLSEVSGSFMMYAKQPTNTEIPDSNTYTWKNPTQIVIQQDDPNYSKTIYIGVQKQDNMTGSYKIQYQLSGDIYQGKVGEQIIGVVNKGEWLYYKYPMNGQQFTITKTIYSNNDITTLDLFVSLNQSNTKPNIDIFNYYLIGHTITIPQDDMQCFINTLRYYTKVKPKPCYIYISVTSEQTVYFTISTQQPTTLLQLYQGLPQSFPLTSSTVFKYNTHHREVIISVYSPVQQCIINAWYGTPESRFKQFTSAQLYYSWVHLTIPIDAMEPLLYIEVSSKEQINNQTFSIGVYDELLFLTESTHQVVEVVKDTMLYFKIAVVQEVDSLLIVTSIIDDGNVWMMATKGIDSRPTPDNYNWSTCIGTYCSNKLLIEKGNLNGQSIVDDYIIGIYGVEDSRISIGYTAGQFKMFNLLNNHQMDLIIPNDEPYYLLYRSQAPQSKLFIMNMAGKVNVIIKQFDNNKVDLIDAIEQNTPALLTQQIDKQNTIRLQNCENCTSLILLQGVKSESHTIIEITNENSSITLRRDQVWRDLLQEDESSSYFYTTKYASNIRIQLFNGEVRVLIKQGYNLDHDDEAEYNYRVKSDQLIALNVTSTYDDTIPYSHFIIKVIGIDVQSVYSIRIESNSDIATLTSGNPQTGIMEPNQMNKFSFESRHNQTNVQYITLSVILKNGTTDNVTLDVEHDQSIAVHLSQTFPRALVYTLVDTAGTYNVRLQSTSQILAYEIIYTGDDMNVLIDNVPFYKSARTGTYTYYEVFVEEASTIYLEAFTCGGMIIIQGTSSHSNLLQGVYDLPMQSTLSSHVQQSISVQPGTYYFSVKSQTLGMKKLSTYTIKQRLYSPATNIPIDSYELGKSGTIQWNINNGNQLTLQIPKVVLIAPIGVTQRIYILLRIGNQQESGTLQCSFEQHYLQTEQMDGFDAFTYLVEQDMSSPGEYIIKTILINNTDHNQVSALAKVIVEMDSQTEELNYPYRPITFYASNTTQIRRHGEGNWSWMFWFLMAILILSLLIYRQIRRNIPQVPTEPAIPNQSIELNYSQFR